MLQVQAERSLSIRYTQRWGEVHNIAQIRIMIMMVDLSMFRLYKNLFISLGRVWYMSFDSSQEIKMFL